MKYIKYLPFLLFLFYGIKLLTNFINKQVNIIDKKIQISKIENGILSIKDLRKENYERFIRIIKIYLKNIGCSQITTLENPCSKLTNIIAYQKDEKLLISCIQNDKLDALSSTDDHLKPTSRISIQSFIARMAINNCTTGIIINNSTFSKESLKFAEAINSSNLSYKIKLIDGYHLTQAVRQLNYLNYQEG